MSDPLRTVQRPVADKATVPIYCESRVAKLGLNQSELPKIDEEFEASWLSARHRVTIMAAVAYLLDGFR